jgi:hypothetical protein
MDDDYYRLVLDNREIVGDVPCVKPAGLILLKARAWTDLSQRRAAGEPIDERDVLKHRNDVFRLAVLLRRADQMVVAPQVRSHLDMLLDSLPADSPDWKRVEQASGLGRAWPGPAVLLELLRGYFRVEGA